MALVTTLVSAFKNHERDLQSVDPETSTVIANIAKKVISKVEEYRGDFWTTTTIANNTRWGRYDGQGANFIYVRRPPIQSVTAIWDDTSYTFASGDEITSTNYVFFPTYVQLLQNWVFQAGNQNVRIDYVSGWNETSIPNFIKEAFLEQMNWEWKRNAEQGQDWIGIESVTSGGQTIVPIQAPLLPSVKQVLDWQRPTVWGA